MVESTVQSSNAVSLIGRTCTAEQEKGLTALFLCMKDKAKVLDPKRHLSQYEVDHKYKIAKLVKWSGYKNKSKAIKALDSYNKEI